MKGKATAYIAGQIACFFLLFCQFAMPVEAGVHIVEGFGPNENAALQDSFRRALENAFGIDVKSDTYVVNSVLVRDQTIAHSRGYIKRYKILEAKKQDDMYIVKTRVEVDKNPVEKKEKILTAGEQFDAMRYARVGVWITNQVASGDYPDEVVAAAIVRGLQSAGFSSAEKMQALKEVNDFDYVVKGSVNCTPVENGFHTQIPISSYVASLTFSVNKLATNETIGQGQYTENAADITATAAAEGAKSKAALLASDYLRKELRADATVANDMYILYISGIHDLNQVSAVRDYLQCAPAVNNVSLRSYNGQQAVVDFAFHGDDQWLAYLLTQNMSCPGMVTKMTNHNIYLTV